MSKPLFDPQSVPVVGIDDHLPSVKRERWQAEALRQRFLTPPAWKPEHDADSRRADARGPTPASVLIAIVQREQPTVLLTQRTQHLHDHPGQVSFPGGRAEPEDGSAVATALREAEEEIGLHAKHVDVLGLLPVYTTTTGFVVTPVVALVHPDFTIRIDPFEVAEVFEVPLAFLMDPANHRRQAMEFDGAKRQFLSMPWDGFSADGEPRHYFIWGATAAMLRNFYQFLSA